MFNPHLGIFAVLRLALHVFCPYSDKRKQVTNHPNLRKWMWLDLAQWRIQGEPNWPRPPPWGKKGRKEAFFYLFPPFLLLFPLIFFFACQFTVHVGKKYNPRIDVARRRVCAVKMTANAVEMHWFYIRVHCMHGSRCKPLPVRQRSSDAIHANGLTCRIKSPRKKSDESERKVGKIWTLRALGRVPDATFYT